jgi:glyoxylase-like metal-dependent hydrolase (beta-lactamase superfamily II)
MTKRHATLGFGLVLCLLAVAGCADRSESVELTVLQLNEKAVFVGTGEIYHDGLLALASERGLVAIDTGIAPSLTRLYRAKVEEIFGRNDFLWVVNTHSHFDHTGGNQVFPEATIVAHELVPQRMQEFDDNRADFVARRRARLETRRRQLADLDPDSDAAQRTRDLILTSERMCDDLESGFVSTPPGLTFSDRMTLDLGDMTLKMAAFGPATHTGDDIMVHVPELDLVATGDLFFAGALQFVFGLEEGLDIEKKLAVLDSILEDEGLEHVVTVHNGVSPRESLVRWRDYMRWVWDAVEETAAAGGSLADVRAKLDLDQRYPDLAGLGLDPKAIARQHDNGVPVVWFARTGGRDASAEVAEILDGQGIEAARAFFAESLPLRDERYLIGENSFNNLGYRLLGESRTDEAVAVFEMNAQAFPDSWNVHDSLGEALAATGQTERALASYRRSVELNPDNANGLDWIERLQAGE